MPNMGARRSPYAASSATMARSSDGRSCRAPLVRSRSAKRSSSRYPKPRPTGRRTFSMTAVTQPIRAAIVAALQTSPRDELEDE